MQLHRLLTLCLFIWAQHSTAQNWSPIGGIDGFNANRLGLGVPVDLNADGTVRAYADYNDNTSSTGGGVVRISRLTVDGWRRMGASNTIQSAIPEEEFGVSINLNASGTIIAIGATGEFSSIESYSKIAVYQFTGNEWVLRGTPIQSEQTSLLNTGAQVAISADGNRIVFAEHWHDQNTQDGTLAGPNFGIIRVFEWDGNDWAQLGNTILGEAEDAALGSLLAFSADGNTLAASDNSADEVTINVYRWDGQVWSQLGAKVPSPSSNLFLTFEQGAISLDGDGNTLVIGAPNNLTEVEYGGKVRVLDWNGFQWNQRGEVIVDRESKFSAFGNAVDISFDGRTIAVGAPFSRFITPNNLQFRGFTRMYNWDGSAFIRVGNTIRGFNANQRFGHSVALSGDGQTVNIATDFAESNFSRVYTFDGLVANHTLETTQLPPVFPNPASEEISIKIPESGTFELSILDYSGKLLRQKSVSVLAESILTEKVHTLQPGMYYLVLSSGQKRYRRKFTVG
ncbi:MAG: T9SS type A sorting domain-containing protein [Bacteroidota bacterium]